MSTFKDAAYSSMSRRAWRQPSSDFGCARRIVTFPLEMRAPSRPAPTIVRRLAATHGCSHRGAALAAIEGTPATLAGQAGFMRTIGRAALRPSTSLQPALAHLDFCPNHIY